MLDTLKKVENILSYISAIAVASMMILTVADVGIRYLTPWNLPGSYAFVSLLFVLVIYLGLAGAQRENSHISIEVLYNNLSRPIRKFLQMTQLSVLFVFVAALAWYTGVSAWENYSMGDTILGAISVLTWPSRMMIPVGLFFLALRFLVQLIILLTQDTLIEEGMSSEPVEEI